jgi:hypothetical protein
MQASQACSSSSSSGSSILLANGTSEQHMCTVAEHAQDVLIRYCVHGCACVCACNFSITNEPPPTAT